MRLPVFRPLNAQASGAVTHVLQTTLKITEREQVMSLQRHVRLLSFSWQCNPREQLQVRERCNSFTPVVEQKCSYEDCEVVRMNLEKM